MRDFKADAVGAESPHRTPSKRWRLRFSLRSLLIACTLVALLLGAFMYRVRTQKQAVAEICKIYGSVFNITYEANWLGRVLPESIQRHLGKDICANVVTVPLHQGRVNGRTVKPTDAELEQLVDAISRLPHAIELSFQSLDLQGDDLVRLAPLRHKIEVLGIHEYYGKLRGDQLEPLGRWTQLRSLSLDIDLLSSGSFNLQPLTSIPNLTHLSLGRGTLNENVFADISKIESLQTLSLSACHFDGEHLRHLQKLPNFTRHRLHNIRAVTEYESHIMDESGNYQPIGNPIFRFEPMGRLRFPLKLQPTIPYYQQLQPPIPPYCRQWLKEILPKVQVGSMLSS